MDKLLNQNLINHWQQLRSMTYDLLDVLSQPDLALRLNFERSQPLGYQFWCMLGAHESWIPLITTGKWQGFACSVTTLKGDDVLPNFRRQMQLADEQLIDTLNAVDMLHSFEDGNTPLLNYMRLVEHEAHHQGQLINFIFAFDLTIPDSWEEKWSLRRD